MSKNILKQDIYEAREVILLGTYFDVAGVVRYNGKPIYDVRPGPITRKLKDLLSKYLEKNGLQVKK